jgi:biotin carboxyl carrier protein
VTAVATYFVTPEDGGEAYRVGIEAVTDGWTVSVERGGRQWTYDLPPAPREGRAWIAGRLRRCAWRDGRLSLDGVEHPLAVESEARRLARTFRTAELDGHRASEVRAPIPGMIVAVEVEEGEHVESGRGLVVIEAMKMENEIVAPVSGIVRGLAVVAGRAVESNAFVCRIEPEEGGRE